MVAPRTRQVQFRELKCLFPINSAIRIGRIGTACSIAPFERQCGPAGEHLSDRKYRQRGYQDSREELPKRAPSDRPAKKDTFGPRPINMPGTRTVSRCSQCGRVLQPTAELNARCPKCAFELHSCKQCTYFDTSNWLECTQPIPNRISPKDKQNSCTFYSMRVMVEKETSTPASGSANDARRAFENLFKK